MFAIDNCPSCGSGRPADSPEGICPLCLMRLGLEGDTETDRGGCPGGEPAPERHNPPGWSRSTETIIEIGAGRVGQDDVSEPIDPSGRLLLLHEIARGGVGVVHRGRDTILGRDLAVKVLQERHRDLPAMVRRFVEEAQIAAQLQHPGIVPIHELGTLADHRPYFTMKLVKGRTLADLLAERGVNGDDRHHLLTILLQVAQTIAYAHDHGVIHRDLKPSNVMVGKYGEVMVMDWGLATVLPQAEGGPTGDKRANPGTASGASDGQFMGTPGYMAPERFSPDEESLDGRVDVFSIGAILCEVLTGRPLYAGSSAVEVRERASRGDVGTALQLLGECGADEDLIALAEDCLATDREGRPRDAGLVAARLTAHLEGLQERLRRADLARAEAQARAVEERKSRRLRAVLTASILSLVALAVVGLEGSSRRRQAKRAEAELILRDSEVARNVAASDPTGDPARWRAARDALRQAALLLADTSETTRGRLGDLTSEVERGFRRAEDDRLLLDRLDTARYRADEGDLAVADAQFAGAFRRAGLDADAGDPRAMGGALSSRPIEVKDALIAALDRWAILRREREVRGHRGVASWKIPLDAARASDLDPWRGRLRDAFASNDREALARMAGADDLEARPALSLWLAGRLLIWSGQVELADGLLRRAWRAYPRDFWINLDLSLALMLDPWRPDLALNYATSAVALRPESAVAHLRLGWIDQVFAYKVEAESEYRTALRLWPEYGRAHARLAGLLFFRSRRAEAADEYRAAIRLMPEEAEPLWIGLGDSLMRLHRLDDAEVELVEAARLYPTSCRVWLQVGRLRLAQRDVNGADQALRRAGELAEPNSPDMMAEVAKERGRVELLRRMPALLGGEERPRDNHERLELARLCGEAGLAAIGARLFAEAIAADPEIEGDRVIRPRCYGAFLAAWAGSGTTRDDPPPDPTERARLRRQALDWLKGELATWKPMLEGGPTGERRDAAAALRGWMNTHELSGVREPESLKGLGPEERGAWQDFWEEVSTRILVDSG